MDGAPVREAPPVLEVLLGDPGLSFFLPSSVPVVVGLTLVCAG